jgi:hypothetical protein
MDTHYLEKEKFFEVRDNDQKSQYHQKNSPNDTKLRVFRSLISVSNATYTVHSHSLVLKCGTVRDIMDIIWTGRKGRHLNTLEKYRIYVISWNNLHMKDTYNDIFNPIFLTFHDFTTGSITHNSSIICCTVS